MKFGIVVFPGSNCDFDTYNAVKRFGGEPYFLWHKEEDIKSVDCIILPGGFSYGDYLRTGAIARFSPIMKSVIKFANDGGLVLGICNGFQILLEAGLLPGAMMINRSLKFLGQDIFIRTENENTPFTCEYSKGDVLRVPIAHFEGSYYADKEVLEDLERSESIIYRYCDRVGKLNEESNPNGSMNFIAGICNKEKNVFGMMPHPERASDPVLRKTDGSGIWKSLLKSKGRVA